MGRSDPPTGFYASMGIPDDPISQGMLGPMQNVLIPKQPKLPIEQAPRALDAHISLEDVEKDFYALMTKSFRLAVEDARTTIVLNDPTIHSYAPAPNTNTTRERCRAFSRRKRFEISSTPLSGQDSQSTSAKASESVG